MFCANKAAATLASAVHAFLRLEFVGFLHKEREQVFAKMFLDGEEGDRLLTTARRIERFVSCTGGKEIYHTAYITVVSTRYMYSNAAYRITTYDTSFVGRSGYTG